MKHISRHLLSIIYLVPASAVSLYAQTDTVPTLPLQSVFITEIKPSFAGTARNTTAITNSEMKERGAQTLSEALAGLPGVSQLTTGAISKPVIRGLYGNRLQVNVAGLRLEDQQWEDEHGLGLSDAGVDRVELIKGPAALLFGSDAVGGVVNVLEEAAPRDSGVLHHNLNLKLFSNTYGAGLDYGLKKRSRNTLLLRGSIESHADYSDGHGERVPNTRFGLYNLKAGYLIQRSHWNSDNRLLVSLNQFGFITDTTELHEAEEESRLSREFEEDHHVALFTVFSSKNTFHLNEQTRLDATLGLQTNHRQEQERGGEADLDLWLNTATLRAALERHLPGNWFWTNGLAAMGQTNTNFGSRIIVPDARVLEGSVFSYLKKPVRAGRASGHLEAGLRYDRRRITTLETRQLNPPSAEVPPFSRPYDEVNGSIGQSLILGRLVLKAELGTGFRAGNLSELAANGQHEGDVVWYIGNPALRVEQCLNLDISADWHAERLALRGSMFRNRFFNYIYLRPTDEERMGFPVYRYVQDDAVLQGFEAGVTVEEPGVFRCSVDYAFLDARRDDGAPLPFTPANRLLLEARYFLPFAWWKTRGAFLSAGGDIVAAQERPAAFETSTRGYRLLHAGAGLQFRSLRLLLSCRNLTDKAYTDHLSRYKPLGILNMGRNIVLNLGWVF